MVSEEISGKGLMNHLIRLADHLLSKFFFFLLSVNHFEIDFLCSNPIIDWLFDSILQVMVNLHKLFNFSIVLLDLLFCDMMLKLSCLYFICNRLFSIH